ncbi:hypothetical protein J132_07167 [Termitomyces sp. J132]|nr:hypothetical protein J132_07167 [Termitomyces sp. J132]
MLSSILGPHSSTTSFEPAPTTTSGLSSTSRENPLSSIISSISHPSHTHPSHPPHSSSTTEGPSTIPTSVSNGPTVPPSSQPTIASSSSQSRTVLSSSQSATAPSGSQSISQGPSSVTISVPAASSSPSTSQSLLPSSSSSTGIVISLPSSVVTQSASSNVGGGGGISTAHTHTVSVTPDLTFVLTETSLAVASVPTTSSPTITNPDAPTTTFTPIPDSGPTTVASLVPLPTGIPGRIFPPTPLDLSQVSGDTPISILFNQELNWPFVVTNSVSSSQIFAWLPVIIATALGIRGDQVKTFALQVYIPSTYHSPQDKDQLGTTWVGYIPSNLVGTLAAMIKTKNSPFYTGVSDPVAQALANHVNPGFSLNTVSSSDLPGTDPGSSGTTSDSGKSRQDAIIGVVSAIGGIAILVLAFLVYRSWKRRRELAHRRMSDPPNEEYIGVRPEGRDFDQDSVGGQRRRSFYYAEDSLRGFQQQSTAGGSNISSSPQQSMVQRRNLSPNIISTPVLRESSMNW